MVMSSVRMPARLPPACSKVHTLLPHPSFPASPSQIITTGFKAIHLIYFFTAGEDEVKCWQIRQGTKAPQAAGTIHTDFGEGPSGACLLLLIIRIGRPYQPHSKNPLQAPRHAAGGALQTVRSA